MIFRADLLLADDTLYVGVRGRAVPLARQTRYQTLCEAAVAACERGRLAPTPEQTQLVGYVDASDGEIRLAPGAHGLVQRAWGATVDRRQLASVKLDRERDETTQFRRAAMRGDAATMARLGPKRGFRW